MIIDVHSHLGVDVVFDEEQSEEQLEEAYAKHGVDGAIVQPFICRPYLEDTRAIHDRIKALCENGKRKYWGMASINPHFRPEDYDAEATRCVRELGFVALKITPIAHAAHPSSKDAMHVCEIARALGVPVMVHTGAGIPFSDPISLMKAAETFRDVTIVMAHAGSEMHNQQATYLAKKFDNIYLEPSWVGVIGAGHMIRELGSTKILYSSDVIENIPVEMAKYRSLVSNPEDLDNIFYKNALSIFGLKF